MEQIGGLLIFFEGLHTGSLDDEFGGRYPLPPKPRSALQVHSTVHFIGICGKIPALGEMQIRCCHVI